MAKRAKNYQLQGIYEIDNKTPEMLDQAVKKLVIATPLTDQWFLVALEAEKISNISSLEITKNLEMENKSSSLGVNNVGTLWDSDRAQDSLRILVENHKVNVILSLLHDLKDLQRNSSYFDYINSCANRLNKLADEVIERVDHLEFDLGLLLKRLFEHAEAIQTGDIGLLLVYIFNTLRAIIDSRFNPDHIELRQEGLVFSYIYEIFQFIEQLNESQIIQWAISNNIPKLLVDIFVSKNEVFTSPVKQKILEALGSIADCESLSEVKFATEPEIKASLVALRKELIRDLIVEFPDRRPLIRPFLDIIDKYEREIKFPKRKK